MSWAEEGQRYREFKTQEPNAMFVVKNWRSFVQQFRFIVLCFLGIQWDMLKLNAEADGYSNY
jgi:hypothetical protein